MSGGAIIGSAVVGAGASAMASKSASKSADKQANIQSESNRLQYELSKEQLEFNKQQYDDWQEIFGDVSKNLADYYNDMDATTYEALGIQNIEQEYTRSRQQLDQALAKRGITNSGAAANALTDLETMRMLGRADASTNAAATVAQQQQSFYGMGLGSQANAQAGINNAYGNQISVLGQQASQAGQQAMVYGQQAGNAMAGVGNAVGSGISNYMQYQATQNNPSNSGVTWTNNNTAGGTGGIYGLDYIGG